VPINQICAASPMRPGRWVIRPTILRPCATCSTAAPKLKFLFCVYPDTQNQAPLEELGAKGPDYEGLSLLIAEQKTKFLDLAGRAYTLEVASAQSPRCLRMTPCAKRLSA